MRFEKPKEVNDYLGAILQLVIAGVQIKCGDPVGAAERVQQIRSKFKGKLEDNPKNMPWTFLSSCVSTALITLLREPRMHCQLDDQELTIHAKRLIAALPDTGDIMATDLTNLALAQCTRDCIQQASEVIAQAAPDAKFEKGHLERMYGDALTKSVTSVFQEHSDLFRGMIEAITGPTATAEKREIAWQRHGAWCRSLYHESPIFSPDSDIDISLSRVYQKLRCYWNDKHKKECNGAGEPLEYRTATVGDLHETTNTWLSNLERGDTIRLIAGGPGSGKSSFAKAFATELLNKDTHRVLFVQLQGFHTAGTTLREVIGRHLEYKYHFKTPHKCEGFPENPLGWHGQDCRPLLMIFDGLDELTTNKRREKDETKKFVSYLKDLLNELNSGEPEKPSAAAIVLGRDVAMNAALEDGGLRLDNLIHVAPIREMTRDDLQLNKNPPDDEIGKGFDPVIDPRKLIEEDTRKSYWDQWCRVQGAPQSEPHQAIHDKRMSDLNGEPLLLHLLIISDFCGDRWEEAANNRNLVYHNIFGKVFKRNKDKELDAYKDLDDTRFFELMEVFGLAAFRGNGRTGDHKEFKRLRKLYANRKTERDIYSKLDGARLENVALLVHSRQEIEGAGFEFVHKSFGEYLAARALLGVANRLQRSWHHDDNYDDELQLALRWVEFVGTGVLSNPVLRFLRDECRQWEPHQIEKTIDMLTAIFDKTLEHGFPVQKSDELSNPTYRHLEHRQKCAERAMLATMTSLWVAQNDNNENGETPVIALHQFRKSAAAALHMIARLFPASPRALEIVPTLSGISLKDSYLQGVHLLNTYLEGADLSGANLSGANLSGANLSGANLYNANLNDANLYNANLNDANLYNASLSEANLYNANLNDANLYNANLSEANLYNANLSGENLRGANLRDADLRDADLRDADLRDADLHDADLRDANLSGANLSEANLIDADLREANLSGANLSGADLVRADLREANLSGANLSGADLVRANLYNANLSGADLSEADLSEVDLSGADLSEADLRKANLSGAELCGANLCYIDLTECLTESISVRSIDFTEYVNLTQDQVNTFFGVKSGWDKTLLPDHLSHPDHWHKSESMARDDISERIEDEEKYLYAWLTWRRSW